MPLPFDATLKDMTRKYTRDFEVALGLAGPQPATVLNVDLSVVSAATDVVLGYGDPLEKVVDLNYQAGHDRNLPRRALMYNTLLHYHNEVPVHTLIVLLRPEADDSALTGRLRYTGREHRGKMDFTYEVERLWRWPVQRLLTGGRGTLPLAMLARVPSRRNLEKGLARVVREIDERLQHEATPEEAALLMSDAYILTGLRVPRETATRLFQGVRSMRESSTYQAILDEGRGEGRIEGIHEMLLLQGREKLGRPTEAEMQTLAGITDVDQLRRLAAAILRVDSWQALLAIP
jgi:hypothetical protein